MVEVRSKRSGVDEAAYLNAAHLKLAGADHKVIANYLNARHGHESIALALHKVGFGEEKIISALNQKELGLTNADKARSLSMLVDNYKDLRFKKIGKEIEKLKTKRVSGLKQR